MTDFTLIAHPRLRVNTGLQLRSCELDLITPHQRTLRTSGRDVKVHKQDRDVSSRARCALSPHHPHSLMFRGVMMNEGLTGPPVAGDGK